MEPCGQAVGDECQNYMVCTAELIMGRRVLLVSSVRCGQTVQAMAL